VDPSDISKPYAQKMEHLARVRDGSKKQLAQGYWLCQIVAAECGGHEIVPLVNHLWSHEAPGFRSENTEIRHWIKTVARATSRRGVWVMDRGRLYEAFLRWSLDFAGAASAWPARLLRIARCLTPRPSDAKTLTARKRA